MKLRKNKLKKIIPKAAYAVVALLIGGFFLKTFIWEYNYIYSKTGSERESNVIGANVEAEEVDETEPTPEEVADFTVPASNPRYISIPSIGNVDKRQVISVGLTRAGALDTPYNIFQAGWYTDSAKPGTGGAIVIDGHNGGPNVVGIFKYLPNAKIGEKVIIERGDGAIFTYTIVKNDAIALENSDAYMKEIFKIIDGKETVTIITCTGEWSQSRQTYLSRQYLRATLDEPEPEPEIEELDEEGVPLRDILKAEKEKEESKETKETQENPEE